MICSKLLKCFQFVILFLCPSLFQSVTAYGRTMIEQTKQEVEQHYNVANGYKNDAEVGFSDVMIYLCLIN